MKVILHLFGYRRLDKYSLVEMMSDLYRNEWRLYQNYFMPAMKLIEKTRIGSRYLKKYDSPQTPFQRVLSEEIISQTQKEILITTYKTLDPFLLKKNIQIKLKRIFQYVKT